MAAEAPAAPPPAVPEPLPAPMPDTAAQPRPYATIVIRPRSASASAGAEAARIAELMQPLAAQMETQPAAATPRFNTVRYFHDDDAAAAQALFAAVRRPGVQWRLQSMAGPRNQPPKGRLEVWLTGP